MGWMTYIEEALMSKLTSDVEHSCDHDAEEHFGLHVALILFCVVSHQGSELLLKFIEIDRLLFAAQFPESSGQHFAAPFHSYLPAASSSYSSAASSPGTQFPTDPRSHFY